METDGITTPFGRRAMTLGMLASQAIAKTVPPDASVDKWKLYRWLCEARPKLGISDRALSVLNALMSFYPKADLLGSDGLVVFPSNAQLSLRTHGMAETTLRRHLAALVESGLLTRRDSPNGKRYVRRDQQGSIDEAFGFSLAPLLARAEEIEQLAAEVVADRLLLQRLRERVTLMRRDIAKLIETALEDSLPGDWMRYETDFRVLVTALPRVPTPENLTPALSSLEALRAEIVKHLEQQIILQKPAGNAGQTERHKQNSKPDSSSDFEPSFETKQGRDGETRREELAGDDGSGDEKRNGRYSQWPVDLPTPAKGVHPQPANISDALKPYPLGLVLQACPEIVAFGPGGAISSWRDLMTAAVVVRSMLAVSASAYENACAILGPENAATVIACILERAGHINSAGGYLRDLTRRAERGEFSLGPMLMALVRANEKPARQVG
ncbi:MULTISPECIES: plasmid replication protein RepC [unclassified Shinella]|uniref:plasmid replication protein RepC n=1 Tax=unclassified Shinella TaxID=2643062 RepID=UPI00225CBB7A|nr:MULTISPECIES: plasmid replication protein RepC [unclassified Shinella]MCO5137498.1 replication initiation protein RepC [Shinella sp.]MDC7257616.1 replication initiation protein RepC [Shinella sp. YE25]CAI0335644.1 putative replication protein C [Rhizobiaceae bacterium]CAK7259947.1 putative replication protein C [Shinella sp. WSC3-e]